MTLWHAAPHVLEAREPTAAHSRKEQQLSLKASKTQKLYQNIRKRIEKQKNIENGEKKASALIHQHPLLSSELHSRLRSLPCRATGCNVAPCRPQERLWVEHLLSLSQQAHASAPWGHAAAMPFKAQWRSAKANAQLRFTPCSQCSRTHPSHQRQQMEKAPCACEAPEAKRPGNVEVVQDTIVREIVLPKL